jgi:hypothetical protein
MTFTRVALVGGAVVLLAFAVVTAIAVGGVFTPVVAFGALVILIGGGNLLYGKHSHGAAASARVRPAQEAQNRAIDEAQTQARRQREQERRQREQDRRQREEARRQRTQTQRGPGPGTGTAPGRVPGRVRRDGEVTG